VAKWPDASGIVTVAEICTLLFVGVGKSSTGVQPARAESRSHLFDVQTAQVEKRLIDEVVGKRSPNLNWAEVYLLGVSEPPRAILNGEMGEIDPTGTRKDGLDAFLEEKVAEGFTIETRTDTHAVIFLRPKGLRRFTSNDPGRFVVEVDEDGRVAMRDAEPRRS
jgi:hypothetical protein